MKRLAAFILLLASSLWSQLNACGFYPYGEEVRFCFLHPRYLNLDKGYYYYNYTSDWYDFAAYDSPEGGGTDWGFYSGTSYNEPNIRLWEQYCKGKVEPQDIEQAIYKLPLNQIKPGTANAMLKYLYRTKNKEAIEYIIFAKKCEQYTWYNEDPWEKEENRDIELLDDLIKEAGVRAGNIKDKQLKERYLFLKIRLAHYFDMPKEVKSVFEKSFQKSPKKGLIYYWALFFYIQQQGNQVKENYYAAQVFANAPDKRFIVRNNYDRSIPVQETLRFAKTPEEAANIWLIQGVRVTGKGLPYLKEVYKNNKSSAGLSFLLLREINKLEDWILTPQYSLFEPSTRGDYWENDNARRILLRVGNDRKYAREVLDFVQNVDFSKTESPMLWRIAETYLAFMAQDNNKALASLKLMEAEVQKGHQLYEPMQLIKGLVLIAAQPKGKAVIPDEVKHILLEQSQKENFKYLFSIGRELEEKGATTLAALLFSKAQEEDVQNWDQTVHWKAKNDVATMYSDYYWEYLTYIDAYYTIPQIRSLIDEVNKYKESDRFNNWLYGETKANLRELYRILGIKYYREGRLKESGEAFKMMGPGHEIRFEENPFYKLPNTPEFISAYKKKNITGSYITANLLSILSKAEHAKESDKDYYYFLAANCYYNLSYYGSTWNMTRRFRSSNIEVSGLPDDEDYFGCRKAAAYYKLAYDNARTEKFRALCLRMLSKCEDHRLQYEHAQNGWQINYRYDIKIPANKIDARFKQKYSSHYEELMSNCTAFTDYFKARR